jgi:hypothetical protein
MSSCSAERSHCGTFGNSGTAGENTAERYVTDAALFMLNPPEFRTLGDLSVSSWNYHQYRFGLKQVGGNGVRQDVPLKTYLDWAAADFAQPVGKARFTFEKNEQMTAPARDTLCNWAQTQPVVCSTLYNLAGNSMMREISADFAAAGRPYDERAVMDAYFDAWLERDTKADDRPSNIKPEHLQLYLLLLERVAVNAMQRGTMDEFGFFPVPDDETVTVNYPAADNPTTIRLVTFPVKRILNRSGLKYIDPRASGTPRYRFEPIWFHRLLIEKYNDSLAGSTIPAGVAKRSLHSSK